SKLDTEKEILVIYKNAIDGLKGEKEAVVLAGRYWLEFELRAEKTSLDEYEFAYDRISKAHGNIGAGLLFYPQTLMIPKVQQQSINKVSKNQSMKEVKS